MAALGIVIAVSYQHRLGRIRKTIDGILSGVVTGGGPFTVFGDR